ncbi:MAG TPA: hypothetical protein VEW42_06615 [Candidatus Eisenbacteria bacterium]|nr:hypothetical protein [Candidatus Eisenbacteria bacterium]
MSQIDLDNSRQKRACGLYGINNGTCDARNGAKWQGEIELRNGNAPLILRVCTAPSLSEMEACGEVARRGLRLSRQ